MDRSEWLLSRKLGASDIASLCGIRTFADACPLGTYMDKVGLRPPRDSPAMRSGRMLEDVVAAMYEETTGRKVVSYPLASVAHPEYPWMTATPDRGVEGYPWWLEIKTARERSGWGEPGTDDVPDGYLLQAHWQLMVGKHLGIEAVDVVVWFLGAEIALYFVEPHPEMHERLFEIGRDFWRLVEAKTPPEPDWTHPATPGLLKLLHRPKANIVVPLDGETGYSVDAWQTLGREISRLEKERDLHRGRIDHAMRDACEAWLPDGTIVTRKQIDHAESKRKAYSEVRMYVKRPRRAAESEGGE